MDLFIAGLMFRSVRVYVPADADRSFVKLESEEYIAKFRATSGLRIVWSLEYSFLHVAPLCEPGTERREVRLRRLCRTRSGIMTAIKYYRDGWLTVMMEKPASSSPVRRRYILLGEIAK